MFSVNAFQDARLLEEFIFTLTLKRILFLGKIESSWEIRWLE